MLNRTRRRMLPGLLLCAAVAGLAGAAPEKAVLADGADGETAFMLDLYQKIRVRDGNIVFSPYSLFEALTMTYAGAANETARQMADVLHLPADTAQVHAAAGALRDRLAAAAAEGKIQLLTANALWPQAGYPVRAAFLDICRTAYGAPVTPLDYEADPEAAARTISTWAAERTRNRIRELVPPGALTPRTRLVLANAIYFKGPWATRFDEKATVSVSFHLAGDETIDVPTMHRRGAFGYAESESFQVLEMPYAGGELALVVLLPKKPRELHEEEIALTPEDLRRCCTRLFTREVDVYLPRFRAASSFRLSGPLISLGMRDAFNPTAADFSGMAGNKGDLLLAAVLHKAFIEVSEEGSEAAAATAVAVTTESIPAEPPVFRADRPFLFFLRDRVSHAILFAGRMADPRP